MADSDALTNADVAAIAKTRESWVAAIKSDDVQGLLMPLAADNLTFPPNEPPLVGVAASRVWHEARVAQFSTAITMSSDELLGTGRWAFERLSFEIRLTPKAGGSAVQDRGTCIWIWRRETGGSWKVARAIWNSVNPIFAPT